MKKFIEELIGFLSKNGALIVGLVSLVISYKQMKVSIKTSEENIVIANKTLEQNKKNIEIAEKTQLFSMRIDNYFNMFNYFTGIFYGLDFVAIVEKMLNNCNNLSDENKNLIIKNTIYMYIVNATGGTLLREVRDFDEKIINLANIETISSIDFKKLLKSTDDLEEYLFLKGNETVSKIMKTYNGFTKSIKCFELLFVYFSENKLSNIPYLGKKAINIEKEILLFFQWEKNYKGSTLEKEYEILIDIYNKIVEFKNEYSNNLNISFGENSQMIWSDEYYKIIDDIFCAS